MGKERTLEDKGAKGRDYDTLILVFLVDVG